MTAPFYWVSETMWLLPNPDSAKFHFLSLSLSCTYRIVHLVIASDVLVEGSEHNHGHHTGQEQNDHQGVHDTTNTKQVHMNSEHNHGYHTGQE